MKDKTIDQTREEEVTNISVTEEPLQVMPSHESPQGSPPLEDQPLSFDGELMLL